MSLALYTPLCDALVLAMNPLIEIVIHELTSNTIAYINGGLSQRQVGDPSLLLSQELEENIDKIVYPKLGADGRLIKSVSVPLEGKWLLCLNVDLSLFSQMKALSETFLHTSFSMQPQSLFKNDWQEKVHEVMHSFLRKQGWSFEHLTTRQKKELLQHLFESGGFSEKKAPDYLAKILKMGRATIFNYLKEWRKHNNVIPEASDA